MNKMAIRGSEYWHWEPKVIDESAPRQRHRAGTFSDWWRHRAEFEQKSFLLTDISDFKKKNTEFSVKHMIWFAEFSDHSNFRFTETSDLSTFHFTGKTVRNISSEIPRWSSYIRPVLHGDTHWGLKSFKSSIHLVCIPKTQKEFEHSSSPFILTIYPS